MDIPDQQQPATRTYTISDAPNQNYFRLSIKREQQVGRAPGLVSNWFHDHFRVGDELLAKAPAGEFYLDINGDRPPLPFSVGVGITPVVRMLITAAQMLEIC
jgi:nitric oxide dioxygenase